VVSSEEDPGRVGTAQLPDEAAGTYLRAIARHWRFVGAICLLTIGVAVVTLSQRGHSYQTSASVLVNPIPQGDPTFTSIGVVLETGDPARTVQTASSLLDSEDAARAAAAAMGPGWTIQRVQSAVSVTPRGQSNVLAVTASAPTAADAVRLADSFAHAAVANRAAVVQRNIAIEVAALQARLARSSRTAPLPSAEVQDLTTRLGQLHAVQDSGRDPTLSVSQTAPSAGATGASAWLIVMLAAIASLALGSAGAVALEFFSPRIRDEADVVNILPGAVLASVPKVSYHHENRGLSPKLLPPLAFEQIRMLRDQIPSKELTSVIMVTSGDEGDGKTTIASALAAAVAESNHQVILFDLDIRNPDVAKLFGVERSLNAWATIDATTSLADLLVQAPGFPGLKLVPAAPGDMSSFESLVERLPELLAEARRVAEWVILDTAPLGAVSDAARVVSYSDGVLMVVRPGHTNRSRLIRARDLLSRTGATLVGTVLVGTKVASYPGRYSAYGHAARTEEGWVTSQVE
jgi:Mrp family chromosome partitioning ATPase